MGVDFVGKFIKIIGDEIAADLYKISDELGACEHCLFFFFFKLLNICQTRSCDRILIF